MTKDIMNRLVDIAFTCNNTNYTTRQVIKLNKWHDIPPRNVPGIKLALYRRLKYLTLVSAHGKDSDEEVSRTDVQIVSITIVV